MRLVKLLALASALTVLMASVAMAGPVFDRIQKEHDRLHPRRLLQ